MRGNLVLILILLSAMTIIMIEANSRARPREKRERVQKLQENALEDIQNARVLETPDEAVPDIQGLEDKHRERRQKGKGKTKGVFRVVTVLSPTGAKGTKGKAAKGKAAKGKAAKGKTAKGKAAKSMKAKGKITKGITFVALPLDFFAVGK